ncbi:hypothetical protein LTR53_007711 [Teratosphaeriaceae sp. CCFEE 6253]|nr:hypothetical protein LTR53_007711 [Teratosphaeriaceae sp. CCFEE 6253]
MSKAASSPTARLLQSSRLFSLPRALPQPAVDSQTATGLYRASETATSPYPTRQAIATPPSSHFRGDWGLKRALPAKTRESGVVSIRVRAQDNTEHITSFSSAADLTQTRQKWLEMGIPIGYKRERTGDRGAAPPPASVFEDGAGPRWKYGGPWLGAMQDGDFERFTRELGAKRGADGRRNLKGRSRVEEFREYLKDRLVEVEIVQARREAQEQGATLSPSDVQRRREQLRPDEAGLDRRLKHMRDDHATQGLSSALTSHIVAFLDLPGVSNSAETSDAPYGVQTEMMRRMLHNIDDDAEPDSPPSTHPSAGLSYLRTNAVMSNHPLHGPQAHRDSVLARVVRPRTALNGGNEYLAKLGVAGIVTADSVSMAYNPGQTGKYNNAAASEVGGFDPDRMAHSMDENLVGGNKMYVQPHRAWIDEKGRIRLETSRGDKEAVAVKTDDVQKIHDARAMGALGVGSGPSATLPPVAERGTAGNANFGHSLPDMRRMDAAAEQRGNRRPEYNIGSAGERGPQRRPDIRRFDEDSQGGMGRNATSVDRIRDILGGTGDGGRR